MNETEERFVITKKKSKITQKQFERMQLYQTRIQEIEGLLKALDKFGSGYRVDVTRHGTIISEDIEQHIGKLILKTARQDIIDELKFRLEYLHAEYDSYISD